LKQKQACIAAAAAKGLAPQPVAGAAAIGDVVFEITSEDSGNEDDSSDVQSVKQDIEIIG